MRAGLGRGSLATEAHPLSGHAGLYVGPFQPSWNLATLERIGITHILCIAESREIGRAHV